MGLLSERGAMRAARNRRRTRRMNIHFGWIVSPARIRRGRPPDLVTYPKPGPPPPGPPSYPIHGPVVRRAIAFQRSAGALLPENAAKHAAAAEVIRQYNAELNHYQTVALPAYNAAVTEWNNQCRAYNQECYDARFAYE